MKSLKTILYLLSLPMSILNIIGVIYFSFEDPRITGWYSCWAFIWGIIWLITKQKEKE